MVNESQFKISVVIPMYNAAKTIERALNSIKDQTFKCYYQIIVVNDGSKDNSQEIVEKYIADHPELNITLINQINGGVSKARNTGLKHATGDFIALLDSDDAWKQKKIEEQVNVFKTCQHDDFLGTGFAGFGINAEDGRLQRIFFKDLLFRNYFQPSTILMKREIVDKVGFYDENQKYAE